MISLINDNDFDDNANDENSTSRTWMRSDVLLPFFVLQQGEDKEVSQAVLIWSEAVLC